MSVIPLTIFFSLLLAGLFIALFVYEQRRRRFASAERDSLLPLADERGGLGGARAPRELNPRGAQVPTPEDHDHDHDHDHAHAHDSGCGCRHGTRPPCPGCLKRSAAPTHLS